MDMGIPEVPERLGTSTSTAYSQLLVESKDLKT
jgi:hypothetical protein